jgi:hypothetical protein
MMKVEMLMVVEFQKIITNWKYSINFQYSWELLPNDVYNMD